MCSAIAVEFLFITNNRLNLNVMPECPMQIYEEQPSYAIELVPSFTFGNSIQITNYEFPFRLGRVYLRKLTVFQLIVSSLE